MFKKELTHDFDGYTAHYRVSINESKLVLTNGSPLTIHDEMTKTLAYISGSLIITSEDANGNIATLQQGIDYTVIPGATAFVPALILSGLNASRFTFIGFLPEKQKELFEYGLRIIRNSLLFNNNLAEIVMLPTDEKTFNSKFAPFVNPANLAQIAELFEEAMRQIERNGYAPLIFTDVSFKMVGLLKKK